MSDTDLRDAWPKMTAVLKHEGPIPLFEFTTALHRLAVRYTREAKEAGEETETKLYISEIRKGSVIVDLITQHPQATILAGGTAVMAGIGTVNTLFTFGKNLKGLLDKFKNDPKPSGVTKADCDDARALSGVVMATLNANLTFNFNAPDAPSFGMNETEARTVDNRAALTRLELDRREANIHTEVLMVWDQVRDAPGVEEGRSPDKGIIAAIDRRPKQIRFASDDLKERMGWKGFNPFEKAFVVDVKELVGPSGTIAYSILKLHDVLDREE